MATLLLCVGTFVMCWSRLDAATGIQILETPGYKSSEKKTISYLRQYYEEMPRECRKGRRHNLVCMENICFKMEKGCTDSCITYCSDVASMCYAMQQFMYRLFLHLILMVHFIKKM